MPLMIYNLLLLLNLSATALLGAEHWIYLDNGHIRLGMNMDAGGSIGWFSHARSSENLLNAFDHGRYIQQSFYGDKDGSDWNGKTWCYNPVQGGSWKGKPATILETKVDTNSLYVKTRPRQWANGEDVDDLLMEQWHRVEGGLAHLRYRMTFTGASPHQTRKHQELPAVFVNPQWHTLVYCDASQTAWSNAPLTRRQPGPPGTPGNIFHASERWAAWVDDRDQGIGIFFPHTDMVTSYRVSDSGVGNCSYLAPLQTWALQPNMTFEFETVLALGSTQQLRSIFGKIAQQSSAQPVVEIIAGGGRAVENKPAHECKISQPFGLAFDSQDNLFICEETHRILRVDAKTGLLSIISKAKPSDAPIGDNALARDASFKAPHNIIADSAGNLYIADTFHYRVRRMDAKTGIVTTIAGNGDKEISGDGGPAVAAGLGWIACIAFNRDNTQLSISGDGKSGIRVVDLTTGLIHTVSGIPGSRAHAVDSKGNFFIPTRHGLRMRSPDGRVQILEDTTAMPPLAGVKHLWVDCDDNILIADAANHRIRKFIVSERKLITLAGNGAKGTEGMPGPAIHALLGEPHGIVSHPRTGDLYIADSRNHRVLRLTHQRKAVHLPSKP